MRTPYTFSIVRYVHDVVGGEFVNVGVALYAPKENYIKAMCTKKYGRLSKLFIEVNGPHFRTLMDFLENQIAEASRKLQTELQLDRKPEDILEVLYRVIVKDDSSLQFSQSGGGLTSNPAKTLEELFERYVDRYSEKTNHVARDDQEIWRVFKKPLEERSVAKYLAPHVVSAPNFEYQFDHAWKNDQLRVLEPISFDLENPESITDKATKWLGRTMALKMSREKFKLYILLGKPSRDDLMKAYTKAENLLHQIPISKEFVHEGEEESFAKEVQGDIERHTNAK